MNSAQESVKEQIQQFSHMQFKAFEPMRIFGGLAADTMEQVVRKNYEVMGDFVEFSVNQVQIPLSSDKAGDILSAQMEKLSAFGELMNSRASEYVELVSTLSEHAREATDDAATQVRQVVDEVVEQSKRAADKTVLSVQQASDVAVDRAKQATDQGSNSVKKAANNAKSVASNRTKKTATNARNNA